MTTHYRQHPDICAAELDGEVCLFHPSSAEYLNLNDTASSIWNLLDQSRSLEMLVEQLQKEFEIEVEVCRQETQQFLDDAVARGMLLAENIEPSHA